MVQVTDESYDEDQPILGNAEGQNLPDELKSQTCHSVTEEAYKSVTSCMMADPINITSPAIALNLMETALRNRNVLLAKHCIVTLNQHVQKDNALKIVVSIGKWLHLPEGEQQYTNFEPSAPPLVDSDNDRNDNWMKEPLSHLRQNCLLEIDKNGDSTLKDVDVQELHYQDLLAITTSDSLSVSSEIIVYSAIMRWCMEECNRRGMTTEAANLKAILKDLIFAPRYGLMSKREFLTRAIDGVKGPDRIGILDEGQTNRILEYIKQKEKKKKDIKELPLKMSQERRRSGTGKKEERPLGEKVLINCLTCWSVVFD